MTQMLKLILKERSTLLQDAQTGALFGRIEASPIVMTEQFFQLHRLDAGTLERAIEWTEDNIQQAKLKIPPGTLLCMDAADMHILGKLVGLTGGESALHIGAVEQLFSRLVLQAFGQSPHQLDLPESPKVFATIVFLRELMHHLGFESIDIAPDTQR
jgi:hypothetical protein